MKCYFERWALVCLLLRVRIVSRSAIADVVSFCIKKRQCLCQYASTNRGTNAIALKNINDIFLKMYICVHAYTHIHNFVHTVQVCRHIQNFCSWYYFNTCPQCFFVNLLGNLMMRWSLLVSIRLWINSFKKTDYSSGLDNFCTTVKPLHYSHLRAKIYSKLTGGRRLVYNGNFEVVFIERGPFCTSKRLLTFPNHF